ncbi:hypothetical protein AIZ14_26140, partial [Salmonella enterica subsp. enterica serovar Typhimurium]
LFSFLLGLRFFRSAVIFTLKRICLPVRLKLMAVRVLVLYSVVSLLSPVMVAVLVQFSFTVLSLSQVYFVNSLRLIS